MSSILSSEAWARFVAHEWGFERVVLTGAPHGESGPLTTLHGFRNAAGRLVHPPLNPYLPMDFRSTATRSSARLQRQWLESAQLVVNQIIDARLASSLGLSPNVTDVRPWQWARFDMMPRFTYRLRFPFSLDQAEPAIRNKISKARRKGYLAERTDKLEDVHVCLRSSEDRQGFDNRLTVASLRMAHELLGADSLRSYVCYAPGGEPASARMVLHRRGEWALDWVAGTRSEEFSSGATQLIVQHVLADLEEGGAEGFDFCGANMPSVASAKMGWGGELTPFFQVERTPGSWVRKFDAGELTGGRRYTRLDPLGAEKRGLWTLRAFASRALRRAALKVDPP